MILGYERRLAKGWGIGRGLSVSWLGCSVLVFVSCLLSNSGIGERDPSRSHSVGWVGCLCFRIVLYYYILLLLHESKTQEWGNGEHTCCAHNMPACARDLRVGAVHAAHGRGAVRASDGHPRHPHRHPWGPIGLEVKIGARDFGWYKSQSGKLQVRNI